MTVSVCSPCVQGSHRCHAAACTCCHGQPRVTLTLVADQPPADQPPVRIGPWRHHRAPWGHQMIDSPTVGVVVYPIGRDADEAAASIAERITEFLSQASAPSGRQALSQPAATDVRPSVSADGADGRLRPDGAA